MVCFLFGYVVVRFREAPLSQLAVHSQLSGQAAPSSGGGLGLDDRLCGYQLADLRVCGLPDSPHRGHQSLSLLPDDLSWPLGGWFTGWAGHWAPWRMTWMASAGREYRSSGTFAADSQSTAIVVSSASDPTIRACCELGDGKAVCNTMTLGTSTPVSNFEHGRTFVVTEDPELMLDNRHVASIEMAARRSNANRVVGIDLRQNVAPGRWAFCPHFKRITSMSRVGSTAARASTNEAANLPIPHRMGGNVETSPTRSGVPAFDVSSMDALFLYNPSGEASTPRGTMPKPVRLTCAG